PQPALATGTACSPTRRQRRSTNQMRSTIINPVAHGRDARKFIWAVLARIYPRNFKSFAYGNPTGPDQAPDRVLLARCTFGCAARTEDARAVTRTTAARRQLLAFSYSSKGRSPSTTRRAANMKTTLRELVPLA